MKLSQTELLQILTRKECPFCEQSKLDGCMFCDKCYGKLPNRLQLKIHNALRNLSEALKDGIDFLEG